MNNSVYVINNGKNTYKMTLQELYNMLDSRCKNVKLPCIVKVNDDYRMPQSMVNELLHRRLNKEKILSK